MHLWIDGQCLQTNSRFRGIGRYVLELIRAIADAHPEVRMSASLNAGLPEAALIAQDVLKTWLRPEDIHIWEGAADSGYLERGRPERRRLSEIALARHVDAIAPDVALSASPFEGSTDHAVPYIPVGRSRHVNAFIFYDAIPWRYPSMYLPSARSRAFYEGRLHTLTSFELGLAISEFSATECRDVAPGPVVANIDAGVGAEMTAILKHREDLEQPTARDFEAKTLLYVGALDWRKNLHQVAHACSLLDEPLRSKIRFQVAGEPNFGLEAELRKTWVAQNLPDKNLEFMGLVSDKRLAELFRSVTAVIQPSLMEGFGLTALEGMAFGAPVIASRSSALKEVIANDEALFDPEDAKDVARAISEVMTIWSFGESLTLKGLARAEHYSWKRSADETVAALGAALARHTKAIPGAEARLDAIAREALATLCDAQSVAQTLAAAEVVREPHPPRLFIEVTATALADHGTGIQRVVNKVSRALLARPAKPDEPTVSLAFGNTFDGFHPAYVSSEGKLRSENRSAATRLRFRKGDTLLMLDSSWAFQAVYRKSMTPVRLNGARIISLLYDLAPLYAGAFSHSGMPPIFSLWLNAALKYSDGFMCISKAVADEFVDLLEAVQYPRPMSVGYWRLGADFDARQAAPSPALTPAPPGAARTFLMVGTLEPRKGYSVALDAFDELWRAGENVNLMLIGKQGWNIAPLARRIAQHPQNGKRLLWFKSASDDDLAHWYRTADALIAASYYEGFGLPIVEAARFGKPVIASDLPVFREVSAAAHQAVFFAAGDSSALARAIAGFKPAERKTAEFSWPSWEESAEEIYAKIRDDDWYVRYAPKKPCLNLAGPPDDYVRMTEAVPERERRFKLQLVSGFELVEGEDSYTAIVRVDNLTDRTWSSYAREDDPRFPITLSYRMRDFTGRVVSDASPRAFFPFAAPPGSRHYLRLTLPVDLAQSGLYLDAELVQEHVAWWKPRLRIPLPQVSAEQDYDLQTATPD